MCRTLLRSLQFNAPVIKNIFKRNFSTDQSVVCSMEPRYDMNRRWMTLPTSKQNFIHPQLYKLKVVSYNILAQDLLLEHLELYLGIKPEWLSWRRRLQLLQREIVRLNPDIVCLQEVQYDHLPQLIQELGAMNGRRLEYIYKKKTGSRTDGCAIVYDACRCQLLEKCDVEYYTEGVPLLNRHNVALFAKFQLGGKEVIVATTHLLYNPRRDDVRCAQVAKLLAELQKFASDAQNSSIMTPIILTGDFNSTTDSPPMDLLTANRAESAFHFEVIDPGELTGSTLQTNWITVDFILRSVCPQNKHQLDVKSVYTLPTITCCNNVGPIPNHYLGSDHYALGAVFELV